MTAHARYPLVIFDFDGTLADSFPWFLGVLNEVAGRYRFRRVAGSELEELRRLGAREVVRRLGIPFWRVPAIAAHMRRRAAADIAEITLFPGVSEVVPALVRGGATLALVSSNAEANVRRVLGEERVRHFRYLECGASLLGKARRFRRIGRAAGLPPHRVLSIGDELRDAEAARAAGFAFGAALWGYTAPDALRDTAAAHLFERMEDIPAAVLGEAAARPG